MNRLASRSYFRDREDEMYCFATVLEEDRVEILRIAAFENAVHGLASAWFPADATARGDKPAAASRVPVFSMLI